MRSSTRPEDKYPIMTHNPEGLPEVRRMVERTVALSLDVAYDTIDPLAYVINKYSEKLGLPEVATSMGIWEIIVEVISYDCEQWLAKQVVK